MTAKSIRNAEAELERFCKDAYEAARYYGNYDRADKIENEFLRLRDGLRKGYPVNYDNLRQQFESLATPAQLGAMAQQAGGSIYGTTGIAGAYDNVLTHGSNIASTTISKLSKLSKPLIPPLNVLTLNGKELAPEWRGAEITSVTREPLHTYTCWLLRFISKWSTDQVHMYLSMEEVSGKDADAMGETFKEALNQRRVG